MAAGSLNEEIQRVAYYNIRPLVFHGYVGPFALIYVSWFYCWTVLYGLEDYFEVGLIVLAIIGVLQILTSLFCLWSVHVRCALTCASVRILLSFLCRKYFYECVAIFSEDPSIE